MDPADRIHRNSLESTPNRRYPPLPPRRRPFATAPRLRGAPIARNPGSPKMGEPVRGSQWRCHGWIKQWGHGWRPNRACGGGGLRGRWGWRAGPHGCAGAAECARNPIWRGLAQVPQIGSQAEVWSRADQIPAFCSLAPQPGIRRYGATRQHILGRPNPKPSKEPGPLLVGRTVQSL